MENVFIDHNLLVIMVGAMPVLTENSGYATEKRLNYVSPFFLTSSAVEKKTQETLSVIYKLFF